jgi:hypothetical protein
VHFIGGFASLLVAASAVLAAPSQLSAAQPLERRQSPTYSKDWSNDKAVLEYDNRAGGVFAVTWNQVGTF